jgi:DNA-binding NarL/FixJ family response regulator
MLVVGRTGDAQAAADELDDLAMREDATMLGAIADQTRAAVLLAHGDAKAALGPLRGALRAWQELDAPYEVAQVRMLLASACRRLDDHERAELECDAARNVFEQLGAAPALAQLDRLLAEEPRRAAGLAATSSRTVTEREQQVLRLVAAGHTNRSIAGEMAISEKTVERHLGNIFTKLGVSNRTSATAHAYDHGLL